MKFTLCNATVVTAVWPWRGDGGVFGDGGLRLDGA
jgi:hypothetical protein